MFGSTAMLPPRTKRWAEAKVLADCINLKVGTAALWKKLEPHISFYRSSNCIFTTMSTRWHYRITTVISGNMEIFRVVGGSVKKPLNFGAG